MKSVCDFFMFRVMIIAFCLFGVLPIYAQDLEKECEAIYQGMWGDKNVSIERLEKTLETAKTYLKKCNDIKGKEEVKAFIAKQIPKIEQKIKELEVNNLIETFNKSIPAKNWDLAFASGNELIKLNTQFTLDVALVLSSIGFDLTIGNTPIDNYNLETISYAKLALQLMNEGKISDTGSYGAFGYLYKSKRCPDGKVNAIGWMNYIIGYIMYVRQKQSNEAIPYLYQSTQIGCETKNIPEAYKLIGDWYLEDFKKSDSPALQKGYATRAVDAYARAYNAEFVNKSSDVLKTAALNRVKSIYRIFHNSDSKGLNEYLKSVNDTPFVDPATPVSPLPKNEQ